MKVPKNNQIKVRVDDNTKQQLWLYALQEGLDMSDIIRLALRDLLAQRQSFTSAKAS